MPVRDAIASLLPSHKMLNGSHFYSAESPGPNFKQKSLNKRLFFNAKIWGRVSHPVGSSPPSLGDYQSPRAESFSGPKLY